MKKHCEMEKAWESCKDLGCTPTCSPWPMQWPFPPVQLCMLHWAKYSSTITRWFSYCTKILAQGLCEKPTLEITQWDQQRAHRWPVWNAIWVLKLRNIWQNFGFPLTLTKDSIWTNFKILAHRSLKARCLWNTWRVSMPAASVDNREFLVSLGLWSLGSKRVS